MENVCVVFESWTIQDGTYSPFFKGELKNLALTLEHAKISKTKRNNFYLNQEKYCNYSFRGVVILNYEEKDEKSHKVVDGNFIVIDTGSYNFFMHSYSDRFPYPVGQFITGRATIAVDDYIWGEESYEIQDAPDIYCNFRIDKILQVKIPRKLISQDEDICICHTYSDPSEYTDENVFEVQDMNNLGEEASFYFLELLKADQFLSKSITPEQSNLN